MKIDGFHDSNALALDQVQLLLDPNNPAAVFDYLVDMEVIMVRLASHDLVKIKAMSDYMDDLRQRLVQALQARGIEYVPGSTARTASDQPTVPDTTRIWS